MTKPLQTIDYKPGDIIRIKRSRWQDIKNKAIVYPVMPGGKLKRRDRFMNWVNRKRLTSIMKGTE